MIKVYREKADKLKGEESLFLRFRYDKDAVAKIKTLPVRFYDPETKEWEIPLNAISKLLEIFDVRELDIEEDVDVDYKDEEMDVDPIHDSFVFAEELALIPDENIRKFTQATINLLPEYFFTCAASSTGKYHPKYALGEGGLVRHTKAAVHIANELFRCESVFKFDDEQKSILLSALNLHDGMKHGLKGGSYTVAEHPQVMADFIHDHAELNELISIEILEKICNCIASHMGQWNTAYGSNTPILPLPQTAMEKFVHMCDYLASRKCLEYNFEV